MSAPLVVTRKLGANRKNTRLWLEGAVLTNAGFTRGAPWTVTVAGNSMKLSLDPNGKRNVAGTVDRPIIDINSTALLSALGTTGDVMQVTTLAPGVLWIEKAVAP